MSIPVLQIIVICFQLLTAENQLINAFGGDNGNFKSDEKDRQDVVGCVLVLSRGSHAQTIVLVLMSTQGMIVCLLSYGNVEVAGHV